MSFFSALTDIIGLTGGSSGEAELVEKKSKNEDEAANTLGDFTEFSVFDLVLTNQMVDLTLEVVNKQPTRLLLPVSMRKMDGASPPLSLYSWDTPTNTWTKQLEAVGVSHSTVVIHNERVVILGGIRDNVCLSGVTTYSLKPTLVAQAEAPLKIARTRASATYYRGLLTVVGGWATQKYLSSMEIYEEKSRIWHLGPELNKPRANAQLIVYRNTLYVFGGYNGREYEKEFERYDEATNKWVIAGKMPEPAAGFAACVWKNYIVFAGGWSNGNNTLQTVCAYDVKEDAWKKPFGIMEKPRKAFQMITIENGELLCAIGGYSDSWAPQLNYEYFNTAQNKWVIEEIPDNSDQA